MKIQARQTQKVSGFSLVELMIVVSIMAIIAIFAVPSYLDYTLKARRSEARTSLLELQVYLEKYYAENNSYPSTLTSGQSTSDNGYYALSLTTSDGQQAYELTATATGTQAKDTHCASFTLTNINLKTATNTDCW